jgi:hypothetical protein
VIASILQNAADEGLCPGLLMDHPAIAGFRLKQSAVQRDIEPERLDHMVPAAIQTAIRD